MAAIGADELVAGGVGVFQGTLRAGGRVFTFPFVMAGGAAATVNSAANAVALVALYNERHAGAALPLPFRSFPQLKSEFSAIRAQGAGGQNVSKVSSVVHLRFDIRALSLPEPLKERLA